MRHVAEVKAGHKHVPCPETAAIRVCTQTLLLRDDLGGTRVLPSLVVFFGSSAAASAPLISCADCGVDGVFHQYAYEATSPRVCDTSGYWTPDEAIGE